MADKESRKSLAMYRLTQAKERLSSSELLLGAGAFKDSISRSYYAIFTAVRALLALEGIDFSKHSGVIAYFQQNYIKTGIFEKQLSKILSQAFQIRNNVDYADFFIVSKEDAEKQHEDAKQFISVIEAYILEFLSN